MPPDSRAMGTEGNGLAPWERLTASQIGAGVDALYRCMQERPDASLRDWVEEVLVAALKAAK